MATAEQIVTITNLSRYGHTQHYISGVLGVPTSTLSDWKRKDPLVAEALCVSQEGVLSDVKARMYKTAMDGTDKDSNTAAQFLLNRYEVNTPDTATTGVSDDDIRDEILDELNT